MRSDIAVASARHRPSLAALHRRLNGLANFFGNVIIAILILYVSRERGLVRRRRSGSRVSIGSLGFLVGALSPRARSRSVSAWAGFGAHGDRVQPLGAAPGLAPGRPRSGPSRCVGPFMAGSSRSPGTSTRSRSAGDHAAADAGKMNASMRFIVWGTIPSARPGCGAGRAHRARAIVVGAIGGLVAFVPVTLSSVRRIVTMPAPVADEPFDGPTVATG